jgi:nucleobase:cation symporter-1, NCS1 family
MTSPPERLPDVDRLATHHHGFGEPEHPALAGVEIEVHGLDTIPNDERVEKPRDLFWPWFGANVNVLGVSFGAFLLAFGIAYWQALIVGIIGGVLSFVFVGLVAIGSKRSSAPTMVTSRSVFGVNGNRVVSLFSWMLAVGWETILTTLAVLAAYTILEKIGLHNQTATEAVSLVIIAAAVVLTGVYGYQIVMRMERWISIVTGVLSIVFIALTISHIHPHALGATKAGGAPAVIGAFCFIMVGFGLGWTNTAGDYSRYLPRRSSGAAVATWTTLGASIPCTVMLIFGILLAGSSSSLSTAIAANPIGALASILPTWFMIPFLFVAVTGMIATAVLEIYSSGLSLLAVGLPVPRYVAASLDGLVMVAGSIYIIFFAQNFIAPFEAFLTTTGVPIAVWCGMFIADLLLRKKEYVEHDLYTARGRYGSVRWPSIVLLIVGTVIGWGLITNNTVGWLDWQGYLLGPLGLGGVNGEWAYSDLGVVIGLVVGFLGYFTYGARTVRAEEAIPVEVTPSPV